MPTLALVAVVAQTSPSTPPATLQQPSSSPTRRKRRRTGSIMRSCFLASLSVRGGMPQLPMLSATLVAALTQQQPVQGLFQHQQGRYFFNGLDRRMSRPRALRMFTLDGRPNNRRPLQSLFSTSTNDDAPKTTTANPVLQRRVCILKNDKDEPIGSHASETIYEKLAESLSLPIVTKGQLVSSATPSDETTADTDNDDPTDHPQKYTHALCLVDYPKGKEDSELPSHQQYALAIQPLIPLDETSKANKKSTKRRSSRKDTHNNNHKSLQKALQIKPHSIDLCPVTKHARSGQPDLLLQAVAPRNGAVVYDLTAGWGQDSLLLATSQGVSRVVMVERDLMVASLLQDALRRVACIAELSFSSNSNTDAWKQRALQLKDRLHLRVGDARDVLQDLMMIASTPIMEALQEEFPQPDIIYLDPMFPPRTKTAAVKKGMQILHGLFIPADMTDSQVDAAQERVTRELEEADLLQLAYDATKVKVVVKRPIKAPTLGGDHCKLKPSNVVEGSINRWDIYVK